MGLVQHNRNHLASVPADMEFISDKGFKTLSSVVPGHQYVHLPAFVRKNEPQFNPREIEDSFAQARFRYYVEVGISRPSSFKRFDHVVPFEDFANYDNIAFLAVGFSAFMAPLMQPHKFPKTRTIIGCYISARASIA